MSEHSMEAVGRVMGALLDESTSWWYREREDGEVWHIVWHEEWRDRSWRFRTALELVTEAVRESTVSRVEDALEALGVTDTVLMHDGMSAVIARALLDAAEVGS